MQQLIVAYEQLSKKLVICSQSNIFFPASEVRPQAPLVISICSFNQNFRLACFKFQFAFFFSIFLIDACIMRATVKRLSQISPSGKSWLLTVSGYPFVFSYFFGKCSRPVCGCDTFICFSHHITRLLVI